jgi:hypothetical protein
LLGSLELGENPSAGPALLGGVGVEAEGELVGVGTGEGECLLAIVDGDGQVTRVFTFFVEQLEGGEIARF